MSLPGRPKGVTNIPGWSLVVVLLLSLPVPARGQAAAPTVVPAAGQRVRVTLRVPPGDAITPEPDRLVDGLVVEIDSTSVTLRPDNGTARRFVRDDVESMQVYRGRSHRFGLLAGWLVAIPVAVFACRNEARECEAGQLIGLVGGIGGAVIGWPRWQDVQFP